jgi:hypothetical protein
MDATVLEENYRRTPTVLGHQQVDLLRAATVPAAPVVVAALLLMVMLAVEAAAVGAPHTELGRRAGGGGHRGSRGHIDSHISGASRGGYNARHTIEKIRRKKSSTAGDNDGFPAFSARLRNLLLPEKFKPLGITKYDAKQDPVQ